MCIHTYGTLPETLCLKFAATQISIADPQIRRFASLTDSQIAVIRKPTNLRICANL